MKNLINELENEIRAIVYELNRLEKVVNENSVFTENEKKIKVILEERIHALANNVLNLRELLGKLQEYDEFDLLHGEIGEVVKGEM